MNDDENYVRDNHGQEIRLIPRQNRTTGGNGQGMTARQQVFVDEYLKDPCGQRAAAAAGYKSPGISSARLLNGKDYPLVAKAVAEGMDAKRRLSHVEAIRIVEELAKVAFFNVKSLFDEKGNLIPLHELPDAVAACVKDFKVSQKTGMGASGPVKLRVVEVKLHDKLNALNQLAQHLGWLKDQSREKAVNENTQVIDWSTMTKRREIVDVVEQYIQGEEEAEARPKPPPGQVLLDERGNEAGAREPDEN